MDYFLGTLSEYFFRTVFELFLVTLHELFLVSVKLIFGSVMHCVPVTAANSVPSFPGSLRIARWRSLYRVISS